MGRRPKGTGSIQPHGTGFRIQYFVDGARRRETFATCEEAEAKLLDRLSAAKRGSIAPEKICVGDLIDLVIEDYEFRRLRSAAVVKWRAEAHLRKAFGKVRAAKLSQDHIKRYVAQRRSEGATDATINRELAIVRRGYTLGAQQDPPLVHRQPYIAKLDEDNVRQGFLDASAYTALLAELPERLKALCVCAYHVGTRKGELRKIRWDQVDFEALTIRLTKRQTKGKRPRTVPIYGDMLPWLEAQKERCPQGCQWVFFHHSRPVGAQLRGWREACERAGMPDLLFHDLRRSAVRNMERAGIPRKVAMEISGHKTESVYRRYDIVSSDDLQSAAKKLAEFHSRKPELRIVNK